MAEHDSDEREGRRRLGDRLDGIVPDSVKKAIYTSLGAVFMTEDSVRRALADIKVPTDAVTYFISQSNKTKEELFQAIAKEVATTLLKDREPTELLQKALEGLTVRMNVDIEFNSKIEGEKSSVKVNVRGRGSKTGG